jgi:hypothetical protein
METPTDPARLALLVPEVEHEPEHPVEIARPVHSEWTVRVESHRLPGGATYTTQTRVLRVYFSTGGNTP